MIVEKQKLAGDEETCVVDHVNKGRDKKLHVDARKKGSLSITVLSAVLHGHSKCCISFLSLSHPIQYF